MEAGRYVQWHPCDSVRTSAATPSQMFSSPRRPREQTPGRELTARWNLAVKKLRTSRGGATWPTSAVSGHPRTPLHPLPDRTASLQSLPDSVAQAGMQQARLTLVAAAVCVALRTSEGELGGTSGLGFQGKSGGECLRSWCCRSLCLRMRLFCCSLFFWRTAQVQDQGFGEELVSPGI